MNEKKWLMVTHVTWGRKGTMSLHGQEAGRGLQCPLQKSLCLVNGFPPPLLDVTTQCSPPAACPARGTAASLSLITCVWPWRPGRTTTRETPAAVQSGSLSKYRLCL